MHKFSRIVLSAILGLALSAPAVTLAQTGTITTTSSVRQQTVNGTVSSVSGSSIMLAGSNSTAYTVDASSAKLYRRYGAAMQVSDIQVGDQLSVRGTVSGTSVIATVIRDMSLQARNGTFSGTVSAISGTSFTLQSKSRGTQTINTDSSTVFKKNGQTASLSDVMVGSTVTVSGVWDRTNTNVTATRVNVIVRVQTFSGTASAITSSGFTLTNKDNTVYTVDASNVKFLRRYGAAMSLADMQSGDSVQVRGTLLVSTITASQVRDISLQSHNGTFVGMVSAINGTSFTLQSKERGSQTINTATSTIFKLGTQKTSFSSLAAGQTVTVSGVWDRTNSNVTAIRVTISVKHPTIIGTLQSANGSNLTVLGSDNTTYTVDASNAHVYYQGYHKADLTALKTNDKVQVRGTNISGTTAITATLIHDLSQTYHSTSTTASTTTTSSN